MSLLSQEQRINLNNPSTERKWKTRTIVITCPSHPKPRYIAWDCLSDSEFVQSLTEEYPGWVELDSIAHLSL